MQMIEVGFGSQIKQFNMILYRYTLFIVIYYYFKVIWLWKKIVPNRPVFKI